MCTYIHTYMNTCMDTYIIYTYGLFVLLHKGRNFLVIYVHIFSGVWGIGLATPNTQLDSVPLGMDNHSWVLHSDGCIYHSGVKVAKVKDCPVEGDIVVSIILL